MGGSASAELADIRMYEILENIFTKFNHRNNIIFCTRYRDDGFLLYKGKIEEIEELFNIANNSHRHLKFTYQISKTEISFLDTFIYKGEQFNLNGTLDIKRILKKGFNIFIEQALIQTACLKDLLRAKLYATLETQTADLNYIS